MSIANEPSSTCNNTTSSPMPTPDSYIGCFISVTSKSEIRYEGFIYYLNTQDSVIGLRDVRSYGTGGRTRNGQHVPPSDKIYEYILFHGTDIKDLQVKAAPSLQAKDLIYNDPAIIQSNNYAESSSSKSEPITQGMPTEFNLYNESSAPNAGSYYPSMFPSHHFEIKLGSSDSSPLEHNAGSSYGMPTHQTQWQGYSKAPGSITGVNQHASPLATASYPMQNPTATNLQPSPPFHHSTLIKSNRLTMPFALNHQSVSNTDDQVVTEPVTHPASLLSVKSLPYSTLPVADRISEPLVRQQQALPTMKNIVRPKFSEHCPARNLYADQKDVGNISSSSLNTLPSASSAFQLHNLSLPPPSQKFNEEFDKQAMNEKFSKDEVWGHLGKANRVSRDDNYDSVSASGPKFQHTTQFTEEFDFQAMNAKFSKHDIWEYLDKVNQRNTVGGMHENGTWSHISRDDTPDLASNRERKPAYNKDDFFDTISRNSINHGARNGQNQSSTGLKLDSETFGNFHWRTQPAFSGHIARRGEYHAQHGRGRGYNYPCRGRAGYRHR